jgi:hypothetical protein
MYQANKFGQRKKCEEGREVLLILQQHTSLPKK